MQTARARAGKVLFEWGPPVQGNFKLSSPKFGTPMQFDERCSSMQFDERRNARTTLVPVAGRPAARGTWHACRRVKVYQKFSNSPTGHTDPQIRRARGEEAVLTWGPPVKVNFELAHTKLGTWVHLGKSHLAPYEERGWGALRTCSARASGLYIRKFARTYRSNGRNHPSQTRRSNAYCANLKSIGGAISVGCMLHCAQRRKIFLTRGPPVYGNFELGTPNSVRGCTLARPYLAPYEERGWGALTCYDALYTCNARAICESSDFRKF